METLSEPTRGARRARWPPILAGALAALTLLVWAPTGHAAFPGANGRIAFELFGDIATMNADGSGVVVITSGGTDRDPAWSPNGEKIAFARSLDGRSSRLYTMNADGSAVMPLTNEVAAEPAWSPDGTRIAFTSTRGGNSDIWVVSAGGGDLRRLTSTGAHDFAPAWSPDGTTIAFASVRNGNTDIYAIRVDGTSQTQLTDHPAADLDPAWSPDGRRLVFSSARGHFPPPGGTFFPLDLYLMNADGSSVALLGGDSANDREPSWSPDGRAIAFTNQDDAPGGFGSRIQSMNVDGSAVTELAGRAASSPDWQTIPSADLAASFAAPGRRHGLLTYTVGVTNAGPSGAENVVITDTLPAGAKFLFLRTRPDGIVCQTPRRGRTGTISCQAGFMYPGDAVAAEITVVIPGGPHRPSGTNTAVVTSSTPDPQPANNSAAVDTSAR
jgi:TolB protein